jgi:hypothetical protein
MCSLFLIVCSLPLSLIKLQLLKMNFIVSVSISNSLLRSVKLDVMVQMVIYFKISGIRKLLNVDGEKHQMVSSAIQSWNLFSYVKKTWCLL